MTAKYLWSAESERRSARVARARELFNAAMELAYPDAKARKEATRTFLAVDRMKSAAHRQAWRELEEKA